MSSRWLIAVVIAVAVALGGGYAALGAGHDDSRQAADPCERRPFGMPRTTEALVERITLSAVDGAACRLEVSREEVVVALMSTERRARFAERHGLTKDEVEDALRAGALRAIDEAERVEAIDASAALLLRAAAETLPLLADALGANGP